jgi:hypothetical protein
MGSSPESQLIIQNGKIYIPLLVRLNEQAMMKRTKSCITLQKDEKENATCNAG